VDPHSSSFGKEGNILKSCSMLRSTIRSVDRTQDAAARVGFVDLEIRGRIACWGVSQHVCFREVDAVSDGDARTLVKAVTNARSAHRPGLVLRTLGLTS
jgi:hypothetical protein